VRSNRNFPLFELCLILSITQTTENFYLNKILKTRIPVNKKIELKMH